MARTGLGLFPGQLICRESTIHPRQVVAFYGNHRPTLTFDLLVNKKSRSALFCREIKTAKIANPRSSAGEQLSKGGKRASFSDVRLAKGRKDTSEWSRSL